MNGLVTRKCCCEQSCCSVTGPLWANRYCFQMSGYEATYEWKECRYNYVDPVYGPRYCNTVPDQGADTDAECEQNSAICHRKLRQTASVAGAVFRGYFNTGACCDGCNPECPDGPIDGFGNPSCWGWFDANNESGVQIRVGVCDKPTWVPPNIAAVGCDSEYVSPPCNCEIAENDRPTVRGVVQDLDLTGVCQVQAIAPDGLGIVCVAMDEVDEPYECPVVARLYCAVDQGLCAPYEACSSSQSGQLRRHQFVISPATFPSGPESDDCPGAFGSPCIGPTSFVFEADLGPGTPPDQATWTCIKAPAYCRDEVCEEQNCGETFPDEPCGERSCSDWTSCYSNADNNEPGCDPQDFTCRGCNGPATLTLPTLTFLPYQNCVFP